MHYKTLDYIKSGDKFQQSNLIFSNNLLFFCFLLLKNSFLFLNLSDVLVVLQLKLFCILQNEDLTHMEKIK